MAIANMKGIRTGGKIAGLAAAAALVVGMLPAGMVGAQTPPAGNCQSFQQTGFQICGRFLEYWNGNGGLAQQGLPLTNTRQEKSPTDGKVYDTQYFERSVFENHTENQKPNDVQLSLLGVFQYKDKYGSGAANQTVSTAAGARKFTETGHTIGGKFLDYWNSHGGLAQQGFPISDEFQEKSDLNGKTYTVQYFQRAVFESHPENQAPYDILLSQLGRFQLARVAEQANIKYPGATGTLSGAGATFPLPLITKWSSVYGQQYSGVKINYQGIGSGGGKTQITNKTVDFAASDSPFTDDQFNAVGGPDVLMHIPWVMGGVAVVYNITGVTTQIKLDGPTIANIFLLKIQNWNDPAIKALNPGVNLPDLAIAVVHRSDGSGTTDITTDYLSKVSSEWKSTVGRGTTVQWPGGVGANGSDGVTQIVKQTPGAVTYVEVSFAKTNNLQYALLKNQSGNYVDITAETVSDAADSLINTAIPADLRYSITNAPGAKSYPLAGTDWALVYVNQGDANKGKELAYFLWWATHDGQQFSDALYYAPIPRSIQQRAEAQIKRMKCGGGNCFP